MPQRYFNEKMGRHNPFSGYFKDNLFEGEIDNAFRPSTNVITAKDSYEIQLALPGYKKDHITISVEQNVLHIEGEEVKESDITGDYSRREFYQSEFSRSFNLPEDVNEDDITAHFEDGILKVRIGRHDHDPKPRTRQIEIS